MAKRAKVSSRKKPEGKYIVLVSDCGNDEQLTTHNACGKRYSTAAAAKKAASDAYEEIASYDGPPALVMVAHIENEATAATLTWKA